MLVYRHVLAFLILFAGVETNAGDYVSSNGKLSDESFYRLVACGAAPGKKCQRGFLRWPVQNVKVAIVDVDGRTTSKQMAIAEHSLQNAISEINSVDSKIRLVPAPASQADIKVYIAAGTRIRSHPMVRDIRHRLGGPSAGVARVFFENGKINEALIIVAAGGRQTKVKSVMLEELTQSLGLMTDVKGRYYRRRSIFAESASSTTTLRDQDARALAIHYASN